MRISKDISIGEVIRNYPHAKDVFNRFGLNHLNTTEDKLEKLGEVCDERGVPLDQVIEALKDNVESEIR